MVCKVDGNFQLDSRDWSIYSSFLNIDTKSVHKTTSVTDKSNFAFRVANKSHDPRVSHMTMHIPYSKNPNKRNHIQGTFGQKYCELNGLTPRI